MTWNYIIVKTFTLHICAKMCLVSFSENLFSAGKFQNRILFSNRRAQKIFQHINSGEFYFNMNYPLNNVQLEPYLLVKIQTSASKHNKKRRLKLFKTILAIKIVQKVRYWTKNHLLIIISTYFEVPNQQAAHFIHFWEIFPTSPLLER